MLYRSKDCKYGADLSSELIEEMKLYAIAAGKKETGGILIGSYERNYSIAAIKKITGPTADSEHGFTWFKRGIKGLKRILDQNWKQKKFYIGEWHYHPFALPTPSEQDIRQMKDIATSRIYKCPEPILIIIGGKQGDFSIRLFVSLGKKLLVELFPVFDLNE